MAYRFKLNESAGTALLRIGAEQFGRALESLHEADATTGIHDTRKCIKRLRALLRLVRPGLDKVAYQNLNMRLRDAGRVLSATRDRDVLRATIAELAAVSPGRRSVLQQVSSTIVPNVASAEAAPHAAVIRHARTHLLAAAAGWKTLELADDTFATLAEGLARGMRDLAEAFEATEGGDEEAFHDLRKTVQRHWRHMGLVEAGWPAYFAARANEAEKISELLGKAQDLTLLLRQLRDSAPASVSQDALIGLRETVEQRRGGLQEAARSHARRLLAEGPRAHARRASEYWIAARALRKSDRSMPAEAAPKAAADTVRPTAARTTPHKRSAAHKPLARKRPRNAH